MKGEVDELRKEVLKKSDNWAFMQNFMNMGGGGVPVINNLAGNANN